MRQETESHRRGGWTRLEIAVVGAVVAFTAAMVLIPSLASGSGVFALRISFSGEAPPGQTMRFALIRQKHANTLLVHHPHPEARWEPVIADESIECVVSFSVESKVYLWGTETTKVTMIADAVAVEYSSPGKPAIFRVIPFERPSGVELVELTIPRDPPSDAEAWRPDAEIESTGR